MDHQQVNFRREYPKPCRNNTGKIHHIKNNRGIKKAMKSKPYVRTG